jgi:hypothetical protein
MGDSHHPGFKPCSGLDENSPLTTEKKADWFDGEDHA